MPHLIAKTGLFEEKTMQKSPSFPTFNLKPQNPSESEKTRGYMQIRVMSFSRRTPGRCERLEGAKNLGLVRRFAQ